MAPPISSISTSSSDSSISPALRAPSWGKAVTNDAGPGVHTRALREWSEDEETLYDELNWAIIADGIGRVARAHGWDGAVHHPQTRIKLDSPPHYRALVSLDESGEHAQQGRPDLRTAIRRATLPIIERFVDAHPDFAYVDQLLTLGLMFDSGLRARRDDIKEWTEENLASLVFSTRKIVHALDDVSLQPGDQRDALALFASMTSLIQRGCPSPDLFMCLISMLALTDADGKLCDFSALGASMGLRSWHDRVFGTSVKRRIRTRGSVLPGAMKSPRGRCSTMLPARIPGLMSTTFTEPLFHRTKRQELRTCEHGHLVQGVGR
ncbi:MAG: hypothetical protein Q4P33_07215 [Flaviflexus sp.]|nr:hypothetical protein [Flaviflexus sp.]